MDDVKADLLLIRRLYVLYYVQCCAYFTRVIVINILYYHGYCLQFYCDVLTCGIKVCRIKCTRSKLHGTVFELNFNRFLTSDLGRVLQHTLLIVGRVFIFYFSVCKMLSWRTLFRSEVPSINVFFFTVNYRVIYTRVSRQCYLYLTPSRFDIFLVQFGVPVSRDGYFF